MHFLVDETGLKLGELSAREVRDVLETFAEVVERVHQDDEAPVLMLGAAWEEVVWRELSLVELLTSRDLSSTELTLLRDVRIRLLRAFERMPAWDDEATPDAVDVQLDGEALSARTLAWAYSLKQGGEAVGCLVLTTAGRAGERDLRCQGRTARLHFITTLSDYLDFLRASLLVEAQDVHRFIERAPRAFPSLVWRERVMDELRTHKSSFFDERLEVLVRHLGVLNDVGARIFYIATEQRDREAQLGSYGVNASSESGRAKGNKKAMQDHTRSWEGQAQQFWWHTKITRGDGGRVHFLHVPPSTEKPDDDHPHGRIVIGIFTHHLTV
jgi:hypothetical protein